MDEVGHGGKSRKRSFGGFCFSLVSTDSSISPFVSSLISLPCPQGARFPNCSCLLSCTSSRLSPPSASFQAPFLYLVLGTTCPRDALTMFTPTAQLLRSFFVVLCVYITTFPLLFFMVPLSPPSPGSLTHRLAVAGTAMLGFRVYLLLIACLDFVVFPVF